MAKKSVISILKDVGAILVDDHFVFSSGKHSDVYINKDALYPHTELTSEVCRMMAEKCKELEIDTVVGPALGGIILSQWLAYHLSCLKKKEVFGVYAEKMADKSFIFTRGYDNYVTGKNILVVEDLTTTGGSVKKIVDLVRKTGGKVVAVCVMVNRNPDEVGEEMMGAPFIALDELRVSAYDEAELPSYIGARPINTVVGHGKKYLAAHTGQKAKK